MGGEKGRSGGARAHSGPPPQDGLQAWLGGDAGRRGKGKATVELPPIEPFEPPLDLPELHREVWDKLAPHAFRKRTLTRGTEQAFRDLCEAIVVRDGLLSQIHRDGYGSKAGKHPLLTEYRGMYQRVESGMLKFRLAPIGRPILEEAVKPADPFAEFEDGAVQ